MDEKISIVLANVSKTIVKLAEYDTAKAIGYAELVKFCMVEGCKKREE